MYARRIEREVPPSSLRAYRPSSSPRIITDITHRRAVPDFVLCMCYLRL